MRRMLTMLGTGLVVGTAAEAKPSVAVEPLEALVPAPAAVVGAAWLAALQQQGGRVPEPFPAQVAALHPYQTGVWSSPFYADVVGMGSMVSVQGTVSVTAVGLAEAKVELTPTGAMGPPEIWAWTRLFRRTRTMADDLLADTATTPAAVRAEVATGLADPLGCVQHVAMLADSGSADAVALVVQTRADVAPTCVPAAIALVARHTPDDPTWPAWFRQAWRGASAVEQAALLGVLADIPERPADLEMLAADARARATVEVRVQEAEQRARDAAPVQCADGSIDRACTCGDPPQQCCVYHGGVDRCLPPPPKR